MTCIDTERCVSSLIHQIHLRPCIATGQQSSAWMFSTNFPGSPDRSRFAIEYTVHSRSIGIFNHVMGSFTFRIESLRPDQLRPYSSCLRMAIRPSNHSQTRASAKGKLLRSRLLSEFSHLFPGHPSEVHGNVAKPRGDWRCAQAISLLRAIWTAPRISGIASWTLRVQSFGQLSGPIFKSHTRSCSGPFPSVTSVSGSQGHVTCKV